MGAVSVRELQRRIKDVLDRVEQGEVIEVTRRGCVVARLAPARPVAEAVRWPDLEKRARAFFGKRRVDPPPSEQIGGDRGRW